MRILIIEDDVKTAETLTLYLRKEQYDVDTIHDGAEGLEQARSTRYDLILLDLMLPGMYGMDVCKALRRESNVPIVMLTARATEDDLVRGLDLGADDYITKPFSPRQVIARIRSVLRRQQENVRVLQARHVTLDTASAQVKVDQRAIDVTPNERKILEALMLAKGKALTRDEIVRTALGHGFDGDERTIDVHVKNLRKKLGSDVIETVFGVGYRIAP